MKKLIRKIKEASFERKTVIITIIGLCVSTAIAIGKLVIGILTDYNLITIAVYTFAILLSKLECLLGIKTNRLSFKKRNALIAVFLFLSSVFFIGFTCRPLIIGREPQEHGLLYVGMVALISFVELGVSIAGIIRVGNRGHYYRNIKIINFCASLIAILTTQITITDFASKSDATVINAWTGIAVGVFIALCAVYILIAPKISVIDREHNVFILKDEAKNKLIDMKENTVEITLCRSSVYGSYIYRAKISENVVDGHIVRGQSLWKRMNVALKILCCILSEILVFVWLAGRFIFFLRSLNLPARLEKKMCKNGFEMISQG